MTILHTHRLRELEDSMITSSLISFDYFFLGLLIKYLLFVFCYYLASACRLGFGFGRPSPSRVRVRKYVVTLSDVTQSFRVTIHNSAHNFTIFNMEMDDKLKMRKFHFCSKGYLSIEAAVIKTSIPTCGSCTGAMAT